MKALSFLSTVSRKGLLLAVGAMVVLGSVFSVPTSVVFAATPTPPSNAALTKAFQHDQSWVNVQQTNLGKANDVVTDIQNLITEAQSQNINTTAISTALATFQSQLSTANSSHTTAANVISAANGFDSNDNVTNAVAAAQTVHDATQGLTDAHVVLVQSTKDVFVAVKAWEKSNGLLKQIDDLEVAYANEQDWLTAQQNNLGKANTVVTNVQTLISAAQSNNLPTTGLSNALTVFQSQLTTATSADTTAAGNLSTHNGFDNSGNVTNAPAALVTVNESKQSLLTAHNVLVQSSNNLMHAMNVWKVQNHISSSSPVYSAFSTAYESLVDLHNSVTVENGAHIVDLDARLNNLLQALLKDI
jgi:hypothetical protein